MEQKNGDEVVAETEVASLIGASGKPEPIKAGFEGKVRLYKPSGPVKKLEMIAWVDGFLRFLRRAG